MNIEVLLQKKQLSVRQCSVRSGIPYTTLLEIVRGKTDIKKCSAQSVYKLAQALGLSMEELLADDAEESNLYISKPPISDSVSQWEAITSVPIAVLCGNEIIYCSSKYKNPLQENDITSLYKMDGEPFCIDIIDNLFAFGRFLDDQNRLYFAGPVALNRFQEYDYRKLIQKAPTFFVQRETIRTISLIEWYIHWNVLIGLVTGQMASTEILMRNFARSKNWSADYEMQKYQLDMSELEKQRNTYAEIQPLLAAVRNGDLDAFMQGYDLSIYSRIGTLASSSWKQTEYLTVKVISLFMHAMIDGGVDYQIAYDASDLFLQRLEKCTDITGMLELQAEFVLYAITTVKNYREQSASLNIVEAAKQYIGRNRNKQITLTELAGAVNANPSYLSRKFSEKEHMTIQQYILREKVHAACNMLKYTDQDITSIASFLCFSSQSHFSSAFRKIMGESPSEYRNRCHNGDEKW